MHFAHPGIFHVLLACDRGLFAQHARKRSCQGTAECAKAPAECAKAPAECAKAPRTRAVCAARLYPPWETFTPLPAFSGGLQGLLSVQPCNCLGSLRSSRHCVTDMRRPVTSRLGPYPHLGLVLYRGLCGRHQEALHEKHVDL